MELVKSQTFIDPTPELHDFSFAKPINLVADINGDGFVDVVTFPTNFQAVPRFKPIVWKNNGDGTFSYATDSLLENSQAATEKYGIEFVRDIVPGDFNNDGRMDYILMDTGYEPVGGPSYFAGNKPHLLVGTDRGLRWESSAFSDSAISFNHIGDAADFDNDGDLDLLSASFWSLGILVNDGNGRFSPQRNLMPASFNDRNSDFDPSGAEFVKVGNHYDIVAGDYRDFGNGAQRPVVLSQDAQGKYQISYYLERPNMPYASDYGAVDMYSHDINGDGREDLVITWETVGPNPHDPKYAGYSNLISTVFIQNESGTLIASHDRDMLDMGENSHLANLVWDDFNGDGYIDFYQQTSVIEAEDTGKLFYINDGTGHFNNDTVEFAMDGSQGDFVQPMFFDANNDGNIDVVSIQPKYVREPNGDVYTIGETVTTWLGDTDITVNDKPSPIVCTFPSLHVEKTAKMIAAVLGKEECDNPEYLRVGTNLLKEEILDYEGLGELALKVIGAQTDHQVVATLWENIVGNEPRQAEMSPYLDMLSAGMSHGELAVLAADTDLNFNNVAVSMVGIDWATYGIF